jgi:serine/threonine protein kinase
MTTVAERAIEDGLVRPLGEGGFGAVWLWKGASGEMAVKIVQKQTGKKHRNVNILTQTRTEAATMSQLKHPHVVGLYHFLETENSLYLCIQLCSGGDLLDLINGSGKLPQWMTKIFFRQLMEAVKYVHDSGFIHRDIKV